MQISKGKILSQPLFTKTQLLSIISQPLLTDKNLSTISAIFKEPMSHALLYHFFHYTQWDGYMWFFMAFSITLEYDN